MLPFPNKQACLSDNNAQKANIKGPEMCAFALPLFDTERPIFLAQMLGDVFWAGVFYFHVAGADEFCDLVCFASMVLRVGCSNL